MCRQSVLPAGNKRSNWKRITDQTMLYWENYNSFHFSFRFWSKWSSIWFKMGRKTVTTMVLLSQLALCVGKVSCQLETQQQSNASALRKLYFQQLVLLAMFWIESGTISIYDSYYLYFVSLWISITLLYYLCASAKCLAIWKRSTDQTILQKKNLLKNSLQYESVYWGVIAVLDYSVGGFYERLCWGALIWWSPPK